MKKFLVLISLLLCICQAYSEELYDLKLNLKKGDKFRYRVTNSISSQGQINSEMYQSEITTFEVIDEIDGTYDMIMYTETAEVLTKSNGNISFVNSDSNYSFSSINLFFENTENGIVPNPEISQNFSGVLIKKFIGREISFKLKQDGTILYEDQFELVKKKILDDFIAEYEDYFFKIPSPRIWTIQGVIHGSCSKWFSKDRVIKTIGPFVSYIPIQKVYRGMIWKKPSNLVRFHINSHYVSIQDSFILEDIKEGFMNLSVSTDYDTEHDVPKHLMDEDESLKIKMNLSGNLKINVIDGLPENIRFTAIMNNNSATQSETMKTIMMINAERIK